jgi:hypothetical protein
MKNMFKYGLVLTLCLFLFPIMLVEAAPVANHNYIDYDLDTVTFHGFVTDLDGNDDITVYYRVRRSGLTSGLLNAWMNTDEMIIPAWSPSNIPMPFSITRSVQRGTMYDYQLCYSWGSLGQSQCEPGGDGVFVSSIDTPLVTIESPINVLNTSVVEVSSLIFLNDFSSVNAYVEYKKSGGVFWERSPKITKTSSEPALTKINLYGLDSFTTYESRVCIEWFALSYSGSGKGEDDRLCSNSLVFISDKKVGDPVGGSKLFPDWGFDKLLSGEYHDLVSASFAVWRNAGSAQIGFLLAFATLPFIVMVMVYTRTRKIYSTLFSMLITTFALHVFGLLDLFIAGIIYFIVFLLMVLSITALWGRK